MKKYEENKTNEPTVFLLCQYGKLNQVRIENCIIIDFCQCNCVLHTHIKTTKNRTLYIEDLTQREQCLGINKPLQKINSNDILVSEY